MSYLFLFINLFDCFISVLRPGKKLFSHVGTKPPLPGYYQYFWGVNFSCSRKQHGDPSVDGTFQNLNFSNVISSKSFPDMLKYEINSKIKLTSITLVILLHKMLVHKEKNNLQTRH